jgi:hypothetical protein
MVALALAMGRPRIAAEVAPAGVLLRGADFLISFFFAVTNQ